MTKDQVAELTSQVEAMRGESMVSDKKDLLAEVDEVIRALAVGAAIEEARAKAGTPEATITDRAIDFLVDLLSESEKDSKRLDKAQELYFGADFTYKHGEGDDAEVMSIALVEIPHGVRVGVDFRDFLDSAMDAVKGGE